MHQCTFALFMNHIVIIGTYIPLHVRKGNQEHLQEILFRKNKKDRQKWRHLARCGRKRKREERIPDLKSSVQGQTVFTFHPLFSGKIQSVTAETGARWNTSDISHTQIQTSRCAHSAAWPQQNKLMLLH